MSVDKWGALPPLNVARWWAGSILLNSRRAFCFCGAQGPDNHLNSIEMLQTISEEKWTLLPVNDKIAKTYHVAAVPFQNKIFLFGGHPKAPYNMYGLSKEGELLEDLSDDALIPGGMCQGSFVA